MAAYETQEFFTDNNVPPWDTWVAYLHEEEHYLISWVPAAMTQLVEGGIRVNPAECFGWASARCPHLLESLATRGVKLE